MDVSDDEVPSEQGDDTVSAEMMHLLHEGVPLALIADLVSPGGPDSPEILAEEGLPDVDWLGERPPSEGAPDADEDGAPAPDDDADDEA